MILFVRNLSMVLATVINTPVRPTPPLENKNKNNKWSHKINGKIPKFNIFNIIFDASIKESIWVDLLTKFLETDNIKAIVCNIQWKRFLDRRAGFTVSKASRGNWTRDPSILILTAKPLCHGSKIKTSSYLQCTRVGPGAWALDCRRWTDPIKLMNSVPLDGEPVSGHPSYMKCLIDHDLPVCEWK